MVQNDNSTTWADKYEQADIGTSSMMYLKDFGLSSNVEAAKTLLLCVGIDHHKNLTDAKIKNHLNLCCCAGYLVESQYVGPPMIIDQ